MNNFEFKNHLISEISRQNKKNVGITEKVSAKRAPRPRSLTTLKLEVVSERARKIARIKTNLETGNYNVESTELAKSLMRHFDENDLK